MQPLRPLSGGLPGLPGHGPGEACRPGQAGPDRGRPPGHPGALGRLRRDHLLLPALRRLPQLLRPQRPHRGIIQQVRVASAEALGLPRFYALLFAGLSRPRLLGLASRAGHLLQGLAAALPGAPLSLLPWVGKYAAASRLAARPYLSGPLPAATAGSSVGLFVGCGANYLYPEAARAAVSLLEAQGVRLVVPPGQLCCGLPAYSAGDAAAAEELAQKNLAAFRGLDAVVALCASCAHRLRGYQGLPEVKLLPELLSATGGAAAGQRLRVAYHAPCHTRFEGAGKGPVLRLLSGLPRVELLAAEDGCCGSGGLFGLSHPKLSRLILHERLRSLLELRPQVIATDCSGCLIQLRSGLAELRRRLPVVHPAQLLAGTLEEAAST